MKSRKIKPKKLANQFGVPSADKVMPSSIGSAMRLGSQSFQGTNSLSQDQQIEEMVQEEKRKLIGEVDLGPTTITRRKKVKRKGATGNY
jgi:hypothetical protein